MTREGFLANPLRHLFRNAELAPPADWVRAAWDNAEFQREAVYSLSRSVTKTGSFRVASDWLDLLAPALEPNQAADLYQRIRDGSERSESEWRGEFEAAFPNSVPLLPSVDRKRELFNKTLGLFCAIYWNEPDQVRSRIQALLNAGFHLNEARMSGAELATFPEGEQCLLVIGPFDPKDNLSVLSLASYIEHEQIITLLKDAGATE